VSQNVENRSDTTLPIPLTTLIGREQEIAEGSRQLEQNEVRLLTLSGPGGVGKTRLAITLAHRVRQDFADGVHFISFASLHDAAFVLPSIAQALRLQGGGSFSPLEHVKSSLQEKQILLLLDCFEQVIGAAPLVVDLLTTCPLLKIVVTSRETLHVRGERVLSLSPLPLPDVRLHPDETIAQYSSVALFVERAQEAYPAFQLSAENAPVIAEICRRLDGLPLALELAAARLRLLSPQELLERLTRRLPLLTDGPRDLPPRQQALRTTIQWSYDLLTADEQRLFRFIASFACGCTLSTLEAVYSMLDGKVSFVVEGASSLLNKHLLYQGEQDERQLLMLATIREYGRELLLACDEWEEVMNKQAQYYVQVVEKAAALAPGREQERAFDRLEGERENLRAALRWLVERGGDMEMALRLIGALSQFWLVRWYISAERHWVEQALAAGTNVAPTIRALALRAAGWLAFVQDDGNRAEEYYQESLKLYEELEEPGGQAATLHWLGSLALTMRNDDEAARSLLDASYALAINASDKTVQALVYTTRGNIALNQGNLNTAQTCFERSLLLSKTIRDKKYRARALRGLGRIRLAQGDFAGARAYIEESLAQAREGKDLLYMTHALDLLGLLTLAQNDATRARTLLEEALVCARTLGVQRLVAYTLAHVARTAAVQGDVEGARSRYEESLCLFREVGDVAGAAACLQGWGVLLARQGNLQGCVYLWGAAQDMLDRIDPAEPLPFSLSIERIADTEYEHMLAEIRTQLGLQAFTVAWEEGRTLTPERILADQPTNQAIVQPPRKSTLTDRESEVLALVAQGRTDAQIAEALIISPRTVHAHLRTIYRKIGVTSRFAAIHYWSNPPG
jgi:predicted ATPase/DNA-binding CsgD family transcriptional regulator/Tfp pilus assembly protein PilF